MNKYTEANYERCAKKLMNIAMANNMPFILAMKTDSKGKTLRTAYGDIRDVLTLVSIILIVLSEQTGEPVKDLLEHVELIADTTEKVPDK